DSLSEEQFRPDQSADVADGDHRIEDAEVARLESAYEKYGRYQIESEASGQSPVAHQRAQIRFDMAGSRLESDCAQAADDRARSHPQHRGNRSVHLFAPCDSENGDAGNDCRDAADSERRHPVMKNDHRKNSDPDVAQRN